MQQLQQALTTDVKVLGVDEGEKHHGLGTPWSARGCKRLKKRLKVEMYSSAVYSYEESNAKLTELKL